jgi:hypothetical protein
VSRFFELSVSTADLDLETRRYPPVGRCIYCGSTEDLTDEHIFPRFLWGSAVLPKASCERCRRLTKEFEQTCARFIFGRFRVVHGLPTDHPRQRPSHLSIEIEQNGNIQNFDAPIADYPGAPLFLLTWAKPGILSLPLRLKQGGCYVLDMFMLSPYPGAGLEVAAGACDVRISHIYGSLSG